MKERVDPLSLMLAIIVSILAAWGIVLDYLYPSPAEPPIWYMDPNHPANR